MSRSSIDSPKMSSKAKTKFTTEDDRMLLSIIEDSSDIDWVLISQQMGNKSARQCRERWQNYLDPRLQKGNWTQDEDKQIITRFNEMGPHWNAIARSLAGRSGNSVRNRYMVLKRRKDKKESPKKNENYNERATAGKESTYKKVSLLLPKTDLPDITPEDKFDLFGIDLISTDVDLTSHVGVPWDASFEAYFGLFDQ